MTKPFENLIGDRWLPEEYGLVDEQGFFVEPDGTRSRVIHQFDRFGLHYWTWLRRQPWIQDGDAEVEEDDDEEQLEGDPYATQKRKKLFFDELGRRWATDGGVADITNPKLYDGMNLRGDSSTTTVIGTVVGYDQDSYFHFVGSLRKSGFKGQIIRKARRA